MPSPPPDTSTGAIDSLEWSDLPVLLSICRTGSLAGAARLLGKDHSTLFRKLNRIEERAGVRFFERSPAGYTMTDAGELALTFGERIESEFHGLGREIDGRDGRLQGNVRVTGPEGICITHMPKLVADFHKLHPGVVIELLEGTAAFDLSRREADLAIRATRKPPDDSLGKKISDFRFCTYASPRYLKSVGSRELSEHDWVILKGFESWYVPSIWKERRALLERAVMQTNSVTTALRASEEGIGLTLMPCYRGDASKALVRVGPTWSHLDLELWIFTHPVLRHTTRVRVLMAYIEEALAPKANLFSGVLSEG